MMEWWGVVGILMTGLALLVAYAWIATMHRMEADLRQVGLWVVGGCLIEVLLTMLCHMRAETFLLQVLHGVMSAWLLVPVLARWAGMRRHVRLLQLLVVGAGLAMLLGLSPIHATAAGQAVLCWPALRALRRLRVPLAESARGRVAFAVLCQAAPSALLFPFLPSLWASDPSSAQALYAGRLGLCVVAYLLLITAARSFRRVYA